LLAKDIKFLSDGLAAQPNASLRQPFDEPQLKFNGLPAFKSARFGQFSRALADIFFAVLSLSRSHAAYVALGVSEMMGRFAR
jgi:hypothetical protein